MSLNLQDFKFTFVTATGSRSYCCMPAGAFLFHCSFSPMFSLDFEIAAVDHTVISQILGTTVLALEKQFLKLRISN
jgi:hypothetical protein